MILIETKFVNCKCLQMKFVTPLPRISGWGSWSRSFSSLLSPRVLESPLALSWVIQESLSLKYEPASLPQHISRFPWRRCASEEWLSFSCCTPHRSKPRASYNPWKPSQTHKALPLTPLIGGLLTILLIPPALPNLMKTNVFQIFG